MEKVYHTDHGPIHYWLDVPEFSQMTLVFLPGLTADHRLFDKQIEYFRGRYNVFTWDAPGHAASWPFRLDFSLLDKARWLETILKSEDIQRPVIIGQSMGGYVGQAYAQLYPERLAGFVSIDSAPLQKRYISWPELWMLRKTETMYYWYPWKALLRSGSNGVATSEYGRKLMRDMMMVYDGDKKRYSQLAGHGFRILADAMEAIIGAVYLDGGEKAAKTLIERLLLPGCDRAIRPEKRLDAKTTLQLACQDAGDVHYAIVGQSGPDHAKHFVAQALLGDRVIGQGEGTSKKHAERSAALDALSKLESLKNKKDEKGAE